MAYLTPQVSMDIHPSPPCMRDAVSAFFCQFCGDVAKLAMIHRKIFSQKFSLEANYENDFFIDFGYLP